MKKGARGPLFFLRTIPDVFTHPVRRKSGTPAQRQLSMKHFRAIKVPVSDSGSTPFFTEVNVVLPANHIGGLDRQPEAQQSTQLPTRSGSRQARSNGKRQACGAIS